MGPRTPRYKTIETKDKTIKTETSGNQLYTTKTEVDKEGEWVRTKSIHNELKRKKTN